MPQPTPYVRAFSFTDNEAASPSAHVPGVSLDAEYDALATTIIGILANLVKIQRDDGALKNAIVTMDSLSPAVITALGAGGTWTPRGAWLPATNYAVGDVVTVATATYVNSFAHVSAGTFVGEVAGRWIKLFDDAGTIPADGSVTSAKIAAGAVGNAAIGFTTFDLTGAIRAAGVAAGTAPLGALLHGKLAAGDVHGKIERTTDAQGAVGYKIIGVGATWAFEMAAGSSNAQLTLGGAVHVTYGGDFVDFAVALRATGPDPSEGVGVHLSYAAGVGYVTARDYDAGAWHDLKVRGKDVYVQAAGVDVIHATSTGVDFPKGLTNNGVAVGYLGIPQNPQNGAYTLTASDVGEHVYSTTAVAQIITVPADVFAADAVILVINDGTATITLHAAGVTLRLAGTATTGDRTIGAGGMAFIKCVAANRFFVSGPGVS